MKQDNVVFDKWKRRLIRRLRSISNSPGFIFGKANTSDLERDWRLEVTARRKAKQHIRKACLFLQFDPTNPTWEKFNGLTNSNRSWLTSLDGEVGTKLLNAYTLNERRLKELEETSQLKPKAGKTGGDRIDVGLAEDILVGIAAIRIAKASLEPARAFLSPGGEFEDLYREWLHVSFRGFNQDQSLTLSNWIGRVRERLIEAILSNGTSRLIRIKDNPAGAKAIEARVKKSASKLAN